MKRSLFFISLMLLAGTVLPQEVEFKAQAPNVVRQGQQFRLTFTVNSQAEDFQAPDIENFTVLAGPSTSSSTNVSIINGKMTRNYQLSYTYVLQTNEKGRFSISPARVEVDGDVYESNSLTIEVIGQKQDASGGTQQPSQGREGSGQSQTPQAKPQGDELFVRVLINKNRVYREEPLVATIKLYSKLNISGLENVKFPDFEGFYKQEIETPTLRQLDKENVNGEIYGTGILRKYLLFPQKSGRLKIGAFQVDAIVQKKVEGQSRSIFDDFFGSFENVRMSVKSDPVTVQVNSLPSGKPADFSGGVGSFDIRASLDKKQVPANEGVTFTLDISGKGNLKVLDPPRVDFAPDLEVYDPRISNDIRVSEGGAQGNKTIEYLIIPRHAGDYRIPPVRLSYFDLGSGSYRRVETQPFTLEVEPGKGDSTAGVSRSYSKKDVSMIGSDIRYIQTDGFELDERRVFLFGSPGFYMVYIGGAVLFVGLFFFYRKRQRENADVALLKNKKANKYARKRLKDASGYLKQGDKDRFYEEILKAMWGYLSDKLGIPVAELSRDSAREKLQAREVSQQISDQFLELIDNCEYARFAPSADEERMDRLYQDALTMISALQQKLK
ncbi:MAG: protein BatD [Bacteroidales bacterium]|nr:protein BatD [Bacteroidales bacterium]